MHRSSSTSRVYEESPVTSSSLSSSSSVYSSLRASMNGEQQLPTYDPLSHVAQRERSRLRSAEKAIHLVPLLLIFCAIILWFFSSPGEDIAYNLISLFQLTK
ncbi:hypothetical protein L6164_019667 [Bauhinia variegata]|uniref:Uncharacterized protein n=1 Tax=Bauhinia variegata TaxID=167791 RepID=A0ACB9MSK5_BAUVA|nr:hypothetical protein L6164_019667 [Bauhinia variegata]